MSLSKTRKMLDTVNKMYRDTEQKQYGYKVGQYDQHGQEIKTIEQAKAYTGEVYATQDEAVDRRYSKGGELSKRRASIFGNARANIFGN